MIDEYLDRLAERLDHLGVRGGAAKRMVAEARDHLHAAAGDDVEDAVRRFGDADEIARMVAAELATAGTRRATFGAFAALALAGLGYVAAFTLQPVAGSPPDLFGGRIDALGPVAGVAIVLLPQVAFVCGCLALLRAYRLRGAPAALDAELRLVRRRGAVAIGAGAGSLAAVAVYALNFQDALTGWWTWTTVASCALLMIPLGLAARGIVRSAVPAAQPGGRAGDVFDDLEPLFRADPLRTLALPTHPWRFALLCAAAVGLVGFAGGWYGEGDPGSGLVRGGFEAIALLLCFAVLGKPLGLRR